MSGGDLHKLIGKRIRAKRKAAKLTQEQLGRQANFSQQAISKFESGDRTIDLYTAFYLAEELNCTVDDFRPEPEPFDY